jgi:hypothetical protein
MSRSGEVTAMTFHFLRRSARHLAHVAVIAGLVGGVARAADSDDGGTVRFDHVRSTSPAIATAIGEGSKRSGTFRRLVDAIDTTNGLVYIEAGLCGHGVRACLVLSVKVAGPYRLLRILVDLRKTDQELIEAIGHELQHAVEVLSDPRLTNYYEIYSFFQREGPTGSGRFETVAAVRAGLDVLAEAKTWAKHH